MYHLCDKTIRLLGGDEPPAFAQLLEHCMTTVQLVEDSSLLNQNFIPTPLLKVGTVIEAVNSSGMHQVHQTMCNGFAYGARWTNSA